MINIERVCVALSKENKQYIDTLVSSGEYSSFSQAVNETIDQRRQNEQFNSCQNTF